jgi:hypothetical protein
MKGSNMALMVGCTLDCLMVICCGVCCVGPVSDEEVEAAADVARVAKLLAVLKDAWRVAAMTVPSGARGPEFVVVVGAAVLGATLAGVVTHW